MSETSKALVVEEVSGSFHLVDIPIPRAEDLHEDDVLVRFHASGICHTDLGSWSGKIPSPFPCILGHEGAGEILAAGKRCQGQFDKGDFVIASFCSCGACSACQRHEPANCDAFIPLNFGMIDQAMQPVEVSYASGGGGGGGEGKQGKARAKYFGQSSFGNIMAVSARSVTKVSSSIAPKLACALACGFQTGFSTVVEKAQSRGGKPERGYERYGLLGEEYKVHHAASAANGGHGSERESFATETLLVLGIGAVGLGALVAGKLMGFGKVIACDLNKERLQLAKEEVGIADIVDPTAFATTEAFVEEMKKRSVDGRGVTLTVEASGSSAALKNGIMSLAVKGKALVVGSPVPTAVLDVPTGAILANVWTIEGVLMGNSFPSVTLPTLVKLTESGQLNVLDKITREYSPEDMDKAVHDAEKGTVIKPVIRWI